MAPAAPAADEWDWDDAPTPPAPAPVETPTSGVLMPDCAACGASLNPENASKLRTGAWKHLGCPKAALVPSGPPPADMPLPSTTEPAPADYVAPKAAETAPAPVKRGRKPKAVPTPEEIVAGADKELNAVFAQVAPPAAAPPPLRAHDHAVADPWQIQSLPTRTLRDQFAMAALPALNPTLAPDVAAAHAYAIADAMLKARG